VCIHGLVRDERGQKMSKTKGNVLDPLELIDRFGADALRFAICRLTGPGRDIKLGPQIVESHRGFVTKIWNAARFLEMNGVAPAAGFDPAAVRTPLCRWLLDAADATVAEATAALEDFRFDEYAEAVYRFTWNTFCDWFVELAKPALAAGALADGTLAPEVRATAAHVFGTVLRLLHPSMPFVTEELWDRFRYGGAFSLIRADWPSVVAVAGSAEARAEIDWLVRFIGGIRTVRAEMNVPPSQLSPVLLRDAAPDTLARAGRWMDAIGRLARAKSVGPLDGPLPSGSAQLVVDEATVILPLAGLIDTDAERLRLARERDKSLAEASKVARKLDNPDFVARAPEEVVNENRERLAALRSEADRLGQALAWLS
jgi:valyl-tRNA synthetase